MRGGEKESKKERKEASQRNKLKKTRKRNKKGKGGENKQWLRGFSVKHEMRTGGFLELEENKHAHTHQDKVLHKQQYLKHKKICTNLKNIIKDIHSDPYA